MLELPSRAQILGCFPVVLPESFKEPHIQTLRHAQSNPDEASASGDSPCESIPPWADRLRTVVVRPGWEYSAILVPSILLEGSTARGVCIVDDTTTLCEGLYWS